MSWAPRKPSITNGGKAIYRPELYGVPDGTDPAVDMPLVQAAIDAAEAESGGAIVRLDATYAMLEAESANCGLYTGIYYGVWIYGDDVIVDGNGTGTLVLTAMPTHTRYTVVLVGDGGFQTGGWPGIDALLATGHITKRTQIKDVTIDSSALTEANMADLAANLISTPIEFIFCQDFIVDGVTIDYGWGNQGGIGCIASCRNWTVKNCTVQNAYKIGYFADGARNGTYDNCDVDDSIVASMGINIATSGDYESYSQNCTIKNCTLAGVYDGLAISGLGALVDSNLIVNKDINETRYGIIVTVGYSVATDVDSDGSAIVTNNTVHRPIGATYEKSWAVYLSGRNAGYGGEPLEVKDCQITGNTISRMEYGLVLGQQAKNNVFQHNILDDCAEYGDASGGTASGNTIGPNP